MAQPQYIRADQATDARRLGATILAAMNREAPDWSAQERYRHHPVVMPPPSAPMAPWEGLLPWQAKRVRDYVEDKLDERVTVRAAAQHAKLSPGYFSRRFRQCFGVTFAKFVARQRIERAKRLMAIGSNRLSEIAAACGFSDQAHFTRTFGALTGSTPSRWRRQLMVA